MAFLDSIPDSKSLNGYWSLGSNSSLGVQETKFVPKNSDGTIVDCTSLSAASFNFMAPQLNGTQQVSATSMTLGTGDATGQILSLSAGQLNSIFNTPVNSPAINYSIEATIGLNTMVIGRGILTLSVGA